MLFALYVVSFLTFCFYIVIRTAVGMYWPKKDGCKARIAEPFHPISLSPGKGGLPVVRPSGHPVVMRVGLIRSWMRFRKVIRVTEVLVPAGLLPGSRSVERSRVAGFLPAGRDLDGSGSDESK